MWTRKRLWLLAAIEAIVVGSMALEWLTDEGFKGEAPWILISVMFFGALFTCAVFAVVIFVTDIRRVR